MSTAAVATSSRWDCVKYRALCAHSETIQVDQGTAERIVDVVNKALAQLISVSHLKSFR